MKRKNIFIVILVLLSAMFITSCGNKQQSNDPSDSNMSNNTSSGLSEGDLTSEEISLESIEEYSGQETISLPFVPFD